MRGSAQHYESRGGQLYSVSVFSLLDAGKEKKHAQKKDVSDYAVVVILFGGVGVCLLLLPINPPLCRKRKTARLRNAGSDATASGRRLDEAFERFLCDKFFLRSEIVDGAKA